MNIIRRYDLAVVVTTYVDGAGNTKKRFKNVGTLCETDTGPVVFLDATFNPAAIARPAGQSAVMISCYPQDKARPQQSEQDDDVSF